MPPDSQLGSSTEQAAHWESEAIECLEVWPLPRSVRRTLTLTPNPNPDPLAASEIPNVGVNTAIYHKLARSPSVTLGS